MRKILVYILFFIVLFGIGLVVFRAFKQRPASNSSDQLPVATSFYPLYFFATRIGGDRANVTNIVPAGAEPHDYELTAQDMAALERSRLVFINGGGLESWGDRLKHTLDPNKTTLVTAGEGLTTQQMSEENNTVIDPHVWLSPPLAQQMVDRIATGFERVDSVNTVYYRTNADTLKRQLGDLDTAYRQGLSHCAQHEIITAHAAFGYLAAAYGLDQVAIAGLSPDAEPSPAQLADIVTFAREHQARAIFFESLVSPKLAQTIATEIGVQTLVLNPLEGLTLDELRQDKDYFSVMRDNLVNLQTALQCTM